MCFFNTYTYLYKYVKIMYSSWLMQSYMMQETNCKLGLPIKSAGKRYIRNENVFQYFLFKKRYFLYNDKL